MPAVTPSKGRADARRNYDRLLRAAREAFATHGADASLNDVARHAGLGPATLYRHFPTREALLDAVLADRHEALTAHAHDLSQHDSPTDALVEWLRAFIAHVMTYRGLAAIVRAGLHDEESAFGATCKDMTAAGRLLLDRASASGEVRADVGIDDVLRLANGVAIAAELAPASSDRLLSLAFDGLRTR